MKKLFAITTVLFGVAEASGAGSKCDDILANQVKVIEGENRSYQLTHFGYTFEVGGKNEKFAGVVDKEAVKRVLIHCSAVTAGCLDSSGIKTMTGELVVSFEIEPGQRITSGSKFKVVSNSFKSEKLEKCILNGWARFSFPEPVGLVQVQVPIKVSQNSSK